MLWLAACGGSDPAASSWVERDSAGVRIVESAEPMATRTLDDSARVRIGVVEGDSVVHDIVR